MQQTATQTKNTASTKTASPFNAVAAAPAHLSLVKDENKITDHMAIHAIENAERPAIIITKESMHTYMGMMKYITSTFPNTPIMFESAQTDQKILVDDSYCAKGAIIGTVDANKHICRNADVIIIFGRGTGAIEKSIETKARIISERTMKNTMDLGDGRIVGGGVNIAMADQSDKIKARNTGWTHTIHSKCRPM